MADGMAAHAAAIWTRTRAMRNRFWVSARVAVLGAALAANAGCMQYLVQPPAPSIAGSPQRVHVNSFAGGTAQQPPYVLASECQDGEQLARVLVKRNFGQGLISWLTLGLYSPATVKYECAHRGAPDWGSTSETEEDR